MGICPQGWSPWYGRVRTAWSLAGEQTDPRPRQAGPPEPAFSSGKVAPPPFALSREGAACGSRASRPAIGAGVRVGVLDFQDQGLAAVFLGALVLGHLA